MSQLDVQMPRVGERVRLTSEVDRFPDALVPVGLYGTVASADDERIVLKLEEAVPELAEWGNCLIWTAGLDSEDGQSVAEAFWEAAEAASPSPAP